MALDNDSQQQVKWNSGNDSQAITSETDSDAMTPPSGSCGGMITCKADHSATTTDGDYVDFYLLPTAGDPDSDTDSAVEYPTTGIYLFRCDVHNDSDPAIQSKRLPAEFMKNYKVRAKPSNGDTYTVSCKITWGVVS